MSLVYKKPSQIQRLLRKFDKVNGGAFIFKLGLLGLIPFFFLFADDVNLEKVGQNQLLCFFSLINKFNKA